VVSGRLPVNRAPELIRVDKVIESVLRCIGPVATLIVALLRDFGAVQQMPSVVKRARCPAAGLPARPA
jgi:hypothetical protein